VSEPCIGVTGGRGFIGQHLCDALRQQGIRYEVFEGGFSGDGTVESFVDRCRVIVHLAGRNRDRDDLLVSQNALFARSLAEAMTRVGDRFVIFASSQYVTRHPDSAYSSGKKAAESMFLQLAGSQGCEACVMRLPNIYGPRGLPFYNSIVATLCWWKVNRPHLQYPLKGDIDAVVQYLDVHSLVRVLISRATSPPVSHVETLIGEELALRDIVSVIDGREGKYELPVVGEMVRQYGEVAALETMPVPPYPLHRSETGSFQELAHRDDVVFGQLSHGTIGPGETRGGHYHHKKEEWFCVLVGTMAVDFYTRDGRYLKTSLLEGREPRFLHIPAGYLHYVRNIGTEPLQYLLIANEVFDPANPDTHPGPIHR
jgi:UDP-2-acetamido-2,6-beta-L-arabino-hexul-4-ose reductase